MSRYVVKVLAPDGVCGYLSHGQRVRFENAHRYPHPSSAKRAAEGYRRKHSAKDLPTEAKVIDTRRGGYGLYCLCSNPLFSESERRNGICKECS